MVDIKLVKSFSSQAELGEGVFYSQARAKVYWVDIYGCKIHVMDWHSHSVETFSTPEPVCWVKEIVSGQLIAGFVTGIFILDEKCRPQHKLWQLPGDAAGNRLNDAKVDRHGNLYFGTMDISEKNASGKLYQLHEPNNAIPIDTGYVVSNGPAFSPDGNIIYSVSSKPRIVYALHLRCNKQPSSKIPFIRLSESQGHPDGVTVDANGYLWVCAWDGSAVLCYSPEGSLVQSYSLPVPRITSVTFAGPELDFLVITSARTGLSPSDLLAFPLSGDTFLFKTNTNGIIDKPANLRIA